MLAEVDLGGIDMAVIDLFRVDQGLIVERWDVMEEILPDDQWVDSGKFRTRVAPSASRARRNPRAELVCRRCDGLHTPRRLIVSPSG